MAIKKLKSGKYQIDYYFQGRRIRETYPNRKTAEQALMKRKIEIAEGKFLDKRKEEKIKFKDFAEEFIEVYAKPNKKSWKRDQLSMKHLKKHFGEKYLSQITSYDIENYKKERIKEVSPSTINRELACLKTMFNKAIEWKKVKENPVREVKLFKENNERIRYLKEDEIKKLLNNLSGSLRIIVIIALNTGMRLSEILNLRWEDIDFSTKLIYIRESKSGESREIPMTDIVYNTLWDLKFTSQLKGRVSPFVFKGIKKYWVSHRFHYIVKKLGIKDFRFHDLRHTFASYLAMMGVNLKTIQELLGHKTFKMTLRYAHLSKDYKREVMEVFESKMDTFWTPKEKSPEEKQNEVSYKLRSINNLDSRSRGGGMEDATDLKSVGSLLP